MSGYREWAIRVESQADISLVQQLVSEHNAGTFGAKIAIEAVYSFASKAYVSVTNTISPKTRRTGGSITSTFFHNRLPAHIEVLWPYHKPAFWCEVSQCIWNREAGNVNQLCRLQLPAGASPSSQAQYQRSPPPEDKGDTFLEYVIANAPLQCEIYMGDRLLFRYACAHCKKRGKRMQRCSRCNTAHYCHRECQRAHWPAHRAVCTEQSLILHTQKGM